MFGKLKKAEVTTDESVIDAILDRGVITDIIPDKDLFKKRLMSGEQLHLYWGADATAPNLHLSHAKNFILLEEFRKLGHKTTILFGDFTARIGDPSDRDSTRDRLTKDVVVKNIEKWKELISPIVDFKDKTNPPQIALNSEWLSKLSFEDVVNLASNFTVQQMVERDMFQKRLQQNKPIHLHEFFYPLMQGYDSVALDVDVECCGTDQTFNALAGRTLLKKLKDKEKFVVTVNLMENPVTKELMSKSTGTGVFLDTTANEMYGAVMSQPDEMTEVLYINVTRLALADLDTHKSSDPKSFKMLVAREITKIFYGENAAQQAEVNWESTFSQGGVPDDIETVEVAMGHKLLDALVENKIVASKTEARRLFDSGAIKFADSGEKIEDQNFTLTETKQFKVGKRRFVEMQVK